MDLFLLLFLVLASFYSRVLKQLLSQRPALITVWISVLMGSKRSAGRLACAPFYC